jgi:Flp pilus assembly protein TadD
VTTGAAEVDTDVAKASALLEIGRAAEARDLLVKAVARRPDHVPALCTLAQAYARLGSYRQMAETADRAIAAAPMLEWGYRLRSTAYRQLKRPTEAIAAGREAVTRAPNLWATHVTLVEALLMSEQPANLKAAYEAAVTAVSLAPNRSAAHVTLGRALLAIGEQKRAHQYFAHAVGLDPENASAHTMLAITELNHGRIADAGRRFNGVVAANPTDQAHRSNASVAAALWLRRIVDYGWLLCFFEILAPWLAGDFIGVVVGLALVAAGLTTGAVLFARLHRPMRQLVLARARERAIWPHLLMLAVAEVFLTLPLVSVLLDPDADTPTLGAGLLLLMIGLFRRFQGRIGQSLRPWRLRRRYRRAVFGTTRPVIPTPRRAES